MSLKSLHLIIRICFTELVTIEVTHIANEIFKIIEGEFHSDLSKQLDAFEMHLCSTGYGGLTIHPDDKSKLRKLFCHMKSRWKESNKNKQRFLDKNEKWLSTPVTVKVNILQYFFNIS